MSLSSFLLPGNDKAKAKSIDKGLDDIFRSTASVSFTKVTFSTCLLSREYAGYPVATTSYSSTRGRFAREETESG